MQLFIKQKEFKPFTGCILISEPFLLDPNFRRTAVLLAEHNDLGSIGFVINKLINYSTDELLPDTLSFSMPVFYGGPVEPNTLHYIHMNHPEIEGSAKINDQIYWGGNLEQINKIITNNPEEISNFKFFLGYSGWNPIQLENEIEIKSWWVTQAKAKYVFTDDLEELWKNLVKTLGKDFEHLANPPQDFLFN